MDCVTTSRLLHNCSVCSASNGETHMVGTAFYCARHCPIHQAGETLAIDEEPKPQLLHLVIAA